MANLITGYRGTEHVTAADAGSFNAATIGADKYIFDRGQNFKAEIISNNLVRIYDGDMLNQGRHIRIDTGDYEDAEIATGLVDTYRNDIIVMRYSKDAESQVESAYIAVIQGISGDEGVDPVTIDGDILNGADMDDVPLYRVKLEGLSIVKVEPLFETTDSILALINAVNSNLANTDKAVSELNSDLNEKIIFEYLGARIENIPSMGVNHDTIVSYTPPDGYIVKMVTGHATAGCMANAYYSDINKSVVIVVFNPTTVVRSPSISSTLLLVKE